MSKTKDYLCKMQDLGLWPEPAWTCMECLDCGYQFEIESDGTCCPKCGTGNVEFSNWT